MASHLFFIVGFERSGTTLVAAMFDRHSQIAVPPETHFFSAFCPPARANEFGHPNQMVRYIATLPRIRDLQLNPDDLLRRLENTQPTWRNLFLEVLHQYGDQCGKSSQGEKTPDHWRSVSDLLDLYPESRVLWVVRDGRDAVSSLMRMPWKRSPSIEVHAWAWRISVARMTQYEWSYPGRILRMRFEDLVRNPEAEARRASEFVGVDFEQRQLDPSVETHVVPDWERPWKDRVFAAPDPSRIGASRRELNSQSLGLLNSIMGRALAPLGYEVE